MVMQLNQSRCRLKCLDSGGSREPFIGCGVLDPQGKAAILGWCSLSSKFFDHLVRVLWMVSVGVG